MTENSSNQSQNQTPETADAELLKARKEADHLRSALDAVIEGSQSVLKYQGFSATARSLFDLCKKQLGAQSGYVALLREDGAENEVLFLDSGGLPCSVNPDLPMPIRGLRAQVYESSEPAYSNDFENSEWVKFMPKGHVTLKNVLFAPMVHNGKTVGLLGLANKETDFDSRDARVASAFGKLAAIALREARHMDRIKKSESALRQSEARFRTLFETMQEGVCLHEIEYDTNGNASDYRILEVNPAYEKITGIKREQALHRNASDLYLTGKPPFLDVYARVVESGRPESFEIFWPPMKKHFMISAFSPHKERFATVFTDITDQKEKEELLRVSEEYLSTTLNSIGDAVITTDTEGRIVRMNPVAEQLTGWSLSEAEHKDLETVFNIRNDKTREKVENPVKKILRTGGIVGLANHTVLISKSGEEYFIDDSGAPITDHADRIIGVVLIFRDITENYQSVKEREGLITAIDQAGEMIVITSTDGIIKYVNPAFERVSGYSRREAIGQNPRILKSGRQDAGFYKQLWDTILAGNRWTGRLINRRKDGSTYISECAISPVNDNDGNLTNFVWIAKDISKDVEMEKRFAQAQRLESIGTLAGGIAHDFNNLLFPIVGMAEMLLEDLPAGSPEQENVREILNAGRRGNELVKQILAFSRQSEQKRMPVRIQNILEEALKLVRATIPADIEIARHIQSDCGLVLADPTQVHQIIMNLVTNAFHAVEPTGGRITVQLREVDLGAEETGDTMLETGRYAKMTVSDTGPGVDPSMLGKIFEPYFTTKKKGKGTGLGLSVVYGIVKECRGDIKVSSPPGGGATFDVFLPLMAKTEDALPGEGIKSDPGGNEHILLVDDETVIVRLERQMLERLGYRITTRTGSLEALDTFRSNPQAYDLIITDMTMPNMTGDQLAQKMIAIKPGVPVILCTGFSERINPEKAEMIGIKGFLMKPVVKSDLARLIRQVLDDSSGDD